MSLSKPTPDKGSSSTGHASIVRTGRRTHVRTTRRCPVRAGDSSSSARAWPDFRTPISTADAIDALTEAYDRAVDERVEIACGGGIGCRGTALAVLAMMAGAPPPDAISWVRGRYHPRAVETWALRRGPPVWSGRFTSIFLVLGSSISILQTMLWQFDLMAIMGSLVMAGLQKHGAAQIHATLSTSTSSGPTPPKHRLIFSGRSS